VVRLRNGHVKRVLAAASWIGRPHHRSTVTSSSVSLSVSQPVLKAAAFQNEAAR